MTVSTQTRRLVLPPPYSQHRIAQGDATAEAAARAPAEGAGTLVWRWTAGGTESGPGRLDLAVVLEPDLALPGARLGFVAGMVALCEAIAAHCPPERDIRIRWPDELRFDTNRLGGARFVLAPGSAEGAVPEWMVFGAELIADRDNIAVPGEYPQSISLTEEGFDDPPAIIESFAAHLMLLFDRWKHEGAEAVARAFAGRLEGGGTIGDAGDLIREGGHEALGPALARAPLWRDATGPIL